MPYGVSVAELLILGFILVAMPLPAYIIGSRSAVSSPGLAFIPVVGYFIVLLRVIGMSGWLTLIVLVPYVGGLVLYLWFAFAIPKQHARTGWWTVALVFLPLVSYYAYALTLARAGAEPQP